MLLRCQVLFLVLVLSPIDVVAVDDPAIVEARNREQAARTARFEIHVREVYEKGALTDQAGISATRPVPAEEMTIESENLLVLNGNKIRIEDNHPNWAAPRFVPHHLVEVSDGQSKTTLFTRGHDSNQTPQGGLESGSNATMAKSYRWLPVTMTVRGLTPTIAWQPVTRLEPSSDAEMIDGDRCLVYTAPMSKMEIRYWMAPEKGYLARRVFGKGPRNVTWQTDIRYRKDDLLGWLPSDWITTESSWDGRALVTTTVTVTSAQLNEAVPDEEFRITFVPGTLVADSAAGKNYRVGSDGTWTEVDPADMISRPAAPSSPMPELPWERGVCVGVGLLVGLGVLLAVWLRLRRKTTSV